MRTGWQLIVEGKTFSPGSFFDTSAIKPSEVQPGFITFDDWHSGQYPLDIATEALDYLFTHQAEIKSLFALSGIEAKTLKFVDSLRGHGGLFNFSSSQLVLLGSLGIDLDIVVMPN